MNPNPRPHCIHKRDAVNAAQAGATIGRLRLGGAEDGAELADSVSRKSEPSLNTFERVPVAIPARWLKIVCKVCV